MRISQILRSRYAVNSFWNQDSKGQSDQWYPLLTLFSYLYLRVFITSFIKSFDLDVWSVLEEDQIRKWRQPSKEFKLSNYKYSSLHYGQKWIYKNLNLSDVKEI